MNDKKCEDPDGCREKAVWLVGVGDRKADRQLSCGRHLNRTCHAMAEAEYPRTVRLTLVLVAEL